MSRYFDDDQCDQNELNLFRANVDRSFAGKRGQTYLRELVETLQAMPVKRLISGAVASDGEVCAMGAFARAKNPDRFKYWATYEKNIGLEDTAQLGKELGMAWCFAWEVAYQNDEGWPANITPEQRHEKMVEWLKSNIKESPMPNDAEIESAAREALGKEGA